MSTNVRNPLLLACYEALLVETVTKALPAGAAVFGLAYDRKGALPSAIGGYAAGICTKATPATDRAMPIATVGYAIGKVAAAAVITVDSPVAVNVAGEMITATGTNYVIGRAVDSSTGSGTALVPHYISIKLA